MSEHRLSLRWFPLMSLQVPDRKPQSASIVKRLQESYLWFYPTTDIDLSGLFQVGSFTSTEGNIVLFTDEAVAHRRVASAAGAIWFATAELHGSERGGREGREDEKARMLVYAVLRVSQSYVLW